MSLSLGSCSSIQALALVSTIAAVEWNSIEPHAGTALIAVVDPAIYRFGE
jgi:hypothetical protein